VGDGAQIQTWPGLLVIDELDDRKDRNANSARRMT